MLSQKVAIDDIKDSEAFVRSQMPKVILTAELREELVSEGLRILREMEKRYEPGRNGLDPQGSSFSGYAAKYLPGKLNDAWHRLEPTHHLVTLPDGKRQWRFDEKPKSLDQMTDVDPDAAGRHGTLQASDTYGGDLERRLSDALDKVLAEDKRTTIKIGLLLGEGITGAECARTLGLRPQTLFAATELIKRASIYMTMLEAA